MNKIVWVGAACILALAGSFAMVSGGAHGQDGTPTATTGTPGTGTPTTGTPTTGTPATTGTASPGAATSTAPAASPTGGAGAATATRVPVGGPDTGMGTVDGGGTGWLWLIALMPVVAFGTFVAASRLRSE
jgi:hypothetical protein